MIGTKLAHYEITSHLGTGGMGEVYQATDLKLGRSIAIKILPEAFTNESDRAARFEREARVLASLNHPNIATIHGVEESGGRKFLVMELVTGETLAEKIKRGAMPLQESLGIATQISEALEAAHEKGVIHRDLKPANIKITPEGKVKVLDFGLAKAFDDEGANANLSNSPTMIGASLAATQQGIILGTAAYMSPEQARGKPVDKRTDIWAFGVVLYEMLAGKQLFEGETASDVLAAVLKQEPDLIAIPVKLRRLIAKCLEKDPKKRLRDIGDWEQLLVDAPNTAPLAGTSAKRTTWLWPTVAALLTVAVAALAWVVWLHRTDPTDTRAVSLDLLPPADEAFAEGRLLAPSPDGRYLAFRTRSGRLGIRDLSTNTSWVLPGERGNLVLPFWSPDSRTIAYFSGTQLKRQEATGGPVLTVCDFPAAVRRGGTWSPNGSIILFSARSQIFQVPAAGGTPVVVLSPDKASGEGSYDYPVFLPDGRHFLYRAVSSAPALYVADVQTGQKTKLADSDSAGMYGGGYLLFARGGNLMAQSFDAGTLRLSGDAVVVVEGVTTVGATGEAAFGISQTGVLAYFAGNDSGRVKVQLTWVDRSGMKLATLGEPILTTNWARISPDGSTVAFTNTANREDQSEDIWLYNVARGTASRFTLGPGRRNHPVWSPDGATLAYQVANPGINPHSAIWVMAGDKEEPLATPNPAARMLPEDWSSDGRYLVERLVAGPNQDDLWIQPLFGDRKLLPFAQGRYNERNSKVSPDSKWIAYSSNETGRSEVYVQSFPTPGHKMQISAEGGDRAAWSRDGKELYFIAPDLKLMAALVKSGTRLEVGQPKALFETGIASGAYGFNIHFDVTKDGRFLIPEELKAESARPLSIVLNWTTMLKR